MTTATQQAAALDAAALAVQIEGILQTFIGIARLEDVDGPARLHEYFDTQLAEPNHGRLCVQPDKITIRRGGGSVLLTLTRQQAREQVLALRAEDPAAAHERDLAHARRTINSRASSFENACRRLGDPSHPAYKDPLTVSDADRYSEFSTVGGAVRDRDNYSAQIAKGLTAYRRLVAAGPHIPDQGRLF